jgi:RNA polymerase primary sigma factor/RNA polymerase sigma factor
MGAFHHPELGRLAHELKLAPARHRLRQLSGVRRALDMVEADHEYPYSLICYLITDYRPRRTADAVLSGKELISDLVELLDAITSAMPLPFEAADGVVYDVATLARRLKVSTKTVSRWRHRGLAACWYTDGSRKPYLAFSGRDVQRFISRNLDFVRRGASFQLLDAQERDWIIRRAREITAAQKCSLHVVTLRLAEETGRAVETIRYTLRKFDHENEAQALFDRGEQPHHIEESEVIHEAHEAGDELAAIAERFGKSKAEIRRIITQVRLSKLAASPVAYIYNESFDAVEEKEPISRRKPDRDKRESHDVTFLRVPSNLPAYLQELYRTPLLTREEEHDLFREMNHLLHQAEVLRKAIVTKQVGEGRIADFDRLMERAGRVKNQIVQANLRLVVSIAKRHLAANPAVSLFELVSDGNLALMRAAEKFDFARGFRFSTYASWAIIRSYARSIPEERTHGDRFQTGRDEMLAKVGQAVEETSPADEPSDQAQIRLAVGDGLQTLSDRERAIVERHFGMANHGTPMTLEQIGRELGLSKERVRQIETKAMLKLRGALQDRQADLMAG